MSSTSSAGSTDGQPASATVGSYSQKEWTIDVGGPLSKELAYRFSYSGTDSGGFWWDYYNKNHALYGALTYRPTDKYELFVNASAAVSAESTRTVPGGRAASIVLARSG